LLEVLGTGARISIGYPGARKLPSWQGGTRFWAVFYGAAAVKKAFGQRRVISIRFRYLRFCIVFKLL
jgi:hypothetical protein